MKENKFQIIYDKNQKEKDEKDFQNFLKKDSLFNLSAFKRLMINDLCRNDILETRKVGNYSLEEIQKALNYPISGNQILIDVSDFLMRISPHYQQLNRYYSNIGLFDWNVEPYDVKTDKLTTPKIIDNFTKNYFNVCGYLEKMNIKHEMSKIMKSLPYQDVFFGVICENSEDFFIQKLDSRMCKLCKVQDGVYNFKINLSCINPLNIGAYPEFIKRAYVQYQRGDIPNKWYIPPSDKQICLKFQEHLTYPMPLLITIVEDIFNLKTYKNLKLQSARTDNYKAILFDVPIDENEVDKPLLTPDTLSAFAMMNKESMPDDVGIIHALGGNAQGISFKDSSNTRNNVADATDDIYNSSGESQELFNGSSSGTALGYSIENDSALIYSVYRQFERWCNRLLKLKKFNKPNYKFAIKIHNTTIFNHSKVSDEYLKASQNGLPCKIDYITSLGKTPSKVLGSMFLENSILKLQDNLIPLSTSYTQSSNDTSGRPSNESQGETLDVAGEQTQENDSNAKR